jgi:hypothetical protein
MPFILGQLAGALLAMLTTGWPFRPPIQAKTKTVAAE